MILAGILLWINVLWAGYNGSMPIQLLNAIQLKLLGLCTVVLLIGKLRRSLANALDRLRHPSPRARLVTALLVSCVAGAYLFATALHQHRDLFPKLHDEQMHLVQMQLIAQGKLWLPAHPHADFFETFHIFNTPVYAPMHFPGTSLLYAPAVWLHLPYYVPPLIVASAIVGLIYLLLTQLIDGVAGLLGSLLMLSLGSFRYVSLMVLSNPVALFFGLLMVLAWLRWRRTGSLRSALLVGVFAGLAAITRPPDALCFAIPIGISMAFDLINLHRKRQIEPNPWRFPFVGTTAVIIAGAAPFLALQLLFNHGVTGHWLRTPHDQYSLRYNPGVNYGLRDPEPARAPATTLPQKQIYYANFVKPFIDMHRPSQMGSIMLHLWIPTAVRTTLPAAALLIFVPAGLLGLRDSRRIAIAAIFPVGLGFYALSVMISWYYLLFTAPAVMLCVLLGMRQVEIAWPRARSWTAPGMALLVIAFAVAAMHKAKDEAVGEFQAPTLKSVNEKLAPIQGRALVLFTYHAGDNIHEEPVYNTGAANPDDAQIVRAHDLGSRNVELFRYYACLQPERMVYRFDRQTRSLERLGNVSDLAGQASASTEAP